MKTARKSSRHGLAWLRNTLVLLIATMVSLSLVELGLRSFSEFPLQMARHTVPHGQLGYVLNTSVSGVDPNGFRNHSLQQHPQIVAIGDSHTYGLGVSSEQSWPMLLGSKLGVSVYNYGVPGYGLLHYIHILDLARSQRAQKYIIAILPTNDLTDACKISTLPYWQKLFSAESIEFDECHNSKQRAETQKWSLRTSLRKVVATIAITDALNRLVWHPFREKMFKWGVWKIPESTLPVRYGDHFTMLGLREISTHSVAMDMSRGLNEQAFEVFRELFPTRVHEVRSNGGDVLVLWIPSKTKVLASLTLSSPEIADSIDESIRHEDQLKDLFREFFDRLDIQMIDPLVDMHRSLSCGRMYPESTDDHPLVLGQLAYATAVHRELVGGKVPTDESADECID